MQGELIHERTVLERYTLMLRLLVLLILAMPCAIAHERVPWAVNSKSTIR